MGVQFFLIVFEWVESDFLLRLSGKPLVCPRQPNPTCSKSRAEDHCMDGCTPYQKTWSLTQLPQNIYTGSIKTQNSVDPYHGSIYNVLFVEETQGN
jgi:hypothetical protein